MINTFNLKNIARGDVVTDASLEQLIISAQINHMNYVFIDRKLIEIDTISNLKTLGYNVIVGQGEQARIKISW